MERDMVKDILILEEEKKRKIAAGRMKGYIVKNVNIKNKNYAHNLTRHTHKHSDEATTMAKLSKCVGGIGLKMNDVLKELYLPMPDYLKLLNLANNEGGGGLNEF